MVERAGAEDRLERILYLLPAAAREGGVPLDQLARTLGVDVPTLMSDVEAITERSFYHLPGGGDDIQISLTPGRIEVWTAGAFRRPPKLSLRETIALAIGLRISRLDDAAAVALIRRIEKEVAVQSAETHESRLIAPDVELGADDPRAVLIDAAESRRACRILYLKPEASAPEERTLEPYVIAYGEGQWYAIGRSREAGVVRVFRVDRILEAHATGGAFEVPDGFDPSDFISAGRVFQGEEANEVLIRYAPQIARWIAEREDVELLEDGSVVVRHRVASPRWLAAHVLKYGASAEVLEPEAMREVIRKTVARMASE